MSSLSSCCRVISFLHHSDAARDTETKKKGFFCMCFTLEIEKCTKQRVQLATVATTLMEESEYINENRRQAKREKKMEEKSTTTTPSTSLNEVGI